MAAASIRLAHPFLAKPFEVRHGTTGEVRPVTEAELRLIGDADIDGLIETCQHNPQNWVYLPTPKKYAPKRWGSVRM
jgi:hypothetical protein